MLLQNWTTLSSSVVFQAEHWFRVVRDKVKLPSNRIIDDYFRIEAPEFVLIYARSTDGRVLVERQYKHGLGKITTTFPAGFIDTGEPPILAAKRELLEETGFRAKTWKHMGTFVLDGTRYSGKAHCYIAEDLEQVSTPINDDMEELEIFFLTVRELHDSIASGDLCLLPGLAIMAMATNPMMNDLYTVIKNEP
ncbi:MAG TPA: NUDIX hydrolase [Nitrospirota bacterium]|nr:NUDIX hydrolase [Nitrospirota bacterium]